MTDKALPEIETTILLRDFRERGEIIRQLRDERDEAVEMLKEILKCAHISDGRRKATYDLIVRLGGYQGKTEGQTDDR